MLALILAAMALQASPPSQYAPYASYSDAIDHGVVFEPPPPPPPPLPGEAAIMADIERAIRTSAEAWNAGDLRAFSDFYTEDAVFLTATGPVRGRRSIYERYKRTYARAGPSSLGHLTFDGLFSRVLDADWAIAYGRFHLVQDPAKPEQTGVFDLLMHRTPQGWRIASDHTS